CRQRLHHHLRGGPSEGAVQKLIDQLTLGGLLRDDRRVQVSPVLFIPLNQPFFHHDLHEFKRRRVADGLRTIEFSIHVANGGRSSSPQHLKDLKFSVGGPRPAVF